jgi:glycosidase
MRARPHPPLSAAALCCLILAAASFAAACSDDADPGRLDVPSLDTSGSDTSGTSGTSGGSDVDPTDTTSGGSDVDPTDTSDTNGTDDVDPTDTSGTTGDADTADTADLADVVQGQGPQRSCDVEVSFTGAPAATAVGVSGSFNGWDPSQNPATFRAGAWRATLTAPPGRHPFKFVIDGQYEGQPPADVYTQWEGGFENRSLIVPDCALPAWGSPDVSISDSGLLTGSVQFLRPASGAGIDPDSVSLTIGDAAVTPTISADGLLTFSYQLPAPGKHSLRLSARDTTGTATEDAPLYLPLWFEAAPFDWRDATMYLIFTDRFRDSDGADRRINGVEERANYLGGDFRGVTAAIEDGYFDALGVNAIWLSPIYDNPDQGYRDKRDPAKLMSGFHGYWPVSYDPDPRYGSDNTAASSRADLKALTAAAHARGIRVLFDIALNHVHESHPYCQSNPDWCALTCECGSPGCGWDPSERGIDCQFDYFLPDLSYRKHDLLTQVLTDTLAMLEEYDVDGLRIDAARHMDHVIMRTLRMTLRDRIEVAGGAPYYLVGETFTDDRGQIMDYVADYELHGQFDFAMRSAIRYVMGPGNGPFTALDDAAAASESPSGYGSAVEWMSPFFGNHDLDRFATVLAQNDQGPWGSTADVMAAGPADTITQWDIINRMSMSFAFLLTYRGVPLIYYGDEIGLAGSQDPDNRRMMIWDHNANHAELLSRVQTLGQARRAIPALRRGGRRELWKNEDLYVYIRDLAPGDAAIVALNKGATRTEAVTVPASYGLEGRTLTSFNSSRSVTVTNNTITVTLDPWEYAIFH